MSKAERPQIVFRQQEEPNVYVSDYVDDFGNRWRISVTGQTEIVAWFAERQPISLTARPLTPQEQDYLKEILTQEQASQSPDQERLSQPSEPNAPEALTVPEPLALEVTLSLVELALEQPYVVDFKVDPHITPGTSQGYGFQLKGNDTIANVNGRANGGRIGLDLYAGGKYSTSTGTQPSVKIPGLAHGSDCNLTVRWVSGDPYYTLRGDLTVN